MQEKTQAKRKKAVSWGEDNKEGNIEDNKENKDPKKIKLVKKEKHEIDEHDIFGIEDSFPSYVSLRCLRMIEHLFTKWEKEHKLGKLLAHVDYQPFKTALKEIDFKFFKDMVNTLPERHKLLLLTYKDHMIVKELFRLVTDTSITGKGPVNAAPLLHFFFWIKPQILYEAINKILLNEMERIKGLSDDTFEHFKSLREILVDRLEGLQEILNKLNNKFLEESDKADKTNESENQANGDGKNESPTQMETKSQLKDENVASLKLADNMESKREDIVFKAQDEEVPIANGSETQFISLVKDFLNWLNQLPTELKAFIEMQTKEILSSLKALEAQTNNKEIIVTFDNMSFNNEFKKDFQSLKVDEILHSQKAEVKINLEWLPLSLQITNTESSQQINIIEDDYFGSLINPGPLLINDFNL